MNYNQEKKMLKLSTKGRYGVRLMLDLALNYGKEPVCLKDVAKRQEISEKYLEHLAVPLKKANLIRSSRGAHGGYFLSKEPELLNLKDIIIALESSVCLVKCANNPQACKRFYSCVVRDVWKDASDKIMETLSRFTLAKMVRKQRSQYAKSKVG
jgi:Rrf2 family protein